MYGIERPLGSTLLAAALLLAAACGPEGEKEGEEDPITEVVDVESAVAVDVSDDLQAPPPKPRLVGQLPADFPPDLPIHLPASLVDFGDLADGWRQVSLLTPDSRRAAGGDLEAELRRLGWTIEGTGGDRWRLSKGKRRARLHFEPADPGTLYRYELP